MFERRRAHSDFSKELKTHLALEIDRLREEGLGEQDAYAQARRNLGNLISSEERFYESTRWMWLDSLRQDVRYAFRGFRKAPVFAVTAILTLALGIGATTSIFTLVDAILLKSLAVSRPGELYRLGSESRCCVWGGYSQNNEFSIVSWELYRHFRDHTHGFSELAAFSAGEPLIGVRRVHSHESAQSFPAEFVSGNYFEMFGVKARAGRALTADDERSGAEPVAVMSYRLWRNRYGQDTSVVGSTFNLNDKPVTIVGITPPGFYGDTLRNGPPDFYMPLTIEPLLQGESSILRIPASHWLDLIGRIRPGANAASIESQMRVELQQWLRSHWSDMDANERLRAARQTINLGPGGAGITSMRQQYEHWLRILMMVTGFVLLIVCANVANLMLIRALERRQQTSLSMALGAKPMRLMRQALTESVVLSLVGGTAGIAVAFAGTRLILHAAFSGYPGFGGVPISASPSPAVLIFAFSVSLVTGLIFGIAPAWMLAGADPIDALRGANRSTRRMGSLSRRTLVVTQAALSLALLSSSGLLSVTLRNLELQNFGFEQDGRSVINIDPQLAGYRDEQLDSLYRRIHDSLTAIPGVSSVALCLYSPQQGGSWNDAVYIDGRPAPGPGDDIVASWDRVSAGYFETIGTPILQGRGIDQRDTNASQHIAVVTEAFAHKFFGNEDPIGKFFGRTDITAARAFKIIGVAKDARYSPFNLDKPPGAMFFVPASQYTVFRKASDTTGDTRSHYLHDIVVLMQPGAVLREASVRQAIGSAEPALPVLFVRSLSAQVQDNFTQQRLIARLTSLFGVLSLILASIGIYGVTAFNVGSRTGEIGLRMALGANRGNVLGMVLRGAAALIGAGLILGIPLSFAAGRVLGNKLYGMSPYDPVVMAGAMLALGIPALVSAFIPALRASSLSPVEALRTEG